MNARILLIVAGMLLPAGCAARPVPVVEAGGPADPSAQATPLPPHSETLDVNQQVLPPLPKDQPAREMKPEMGGPHKGMHHVIAPTKPGEAAALSAPRWTPTTAPATAPSGPDSHPGATHSAGHEGHGGTEP